MVRLKQRYIVCELVSDSKPCVLSLIDSDIIHCLRSEVQRLHGDYGLAVVHLSLRVIYYNKYTRIVIIRVKRGLHDLLLQTMALISQIRTTDVSFRTIHIAGSIRSCKKFLIRYYQRHKPFLLGSRPSNSSALAMQDVVSDVENIDNNGQA